MMNDAPIHLEGLRICNKQSGAEASVTIPVWITQSSLDGMHSIIKVLEGFEKSGKGQISGSFELTMFYRTIRDCISKANQAAKENSNGNN